MKKTLSVLAITFVIAGLVISSTAHIPKSQTNIPSTPDSVDTDIRIKTLNGDTIIERLRRVINGELIDVDIADTADIAPGKINGTAWTRLNDGDGSGLDADTVDGLESDQFLRSDTSGTLNGDLTINGDLTWQTKTSYLSVIPAAFTPKGGGFVYTNNGDYVRGLDSSSLAYVAPVELPHGSTVTKMTFYWADASSFYNGGAYLYKRPHPGSPQEMALAGTHGDTGVSTSSFDDTINYAVIDNSQNGYYLELALWSTNIVCYGVILEYTTTGP